ncbi:MAG: dUTP diphosphatase [Clostridia bacterium]|nr:dUTP diphosphatase [Clostridia bacterium]
MMIMKINVRIKRLHPTVTLPAYASEDAAGMDLHAAIDAPVEIPPHERIRIPCGFAMAPERRDVAALLFARSGLAHKKGLMPSNAVGVVDADYRGEVMVSVLNNSNETYVMQPDERFAQMVIMPVLQAEITECEELDDTERGAGGFGSTGV